MTNVTPIAAQADDQLSAELSDALEALLWFGCAMLNAGDTAFRVREWMEKLAHEMGFDSVSVSFTLNNAIASARRGRQRATLVREIGPPQINAQKITELERLAAGSNGSRTAREIATKLSEIEAKPPSYSVGLIVTAIGAACGAFAFLNGGSLSEIAAAAIGGGIGQWLRSALSYRGFNHYGLTALCAVVASGGYVLIAIILMRAGLGPAQHTAGFISSVLFLIPGFPLVAALLDLLQYQTVAALTRVAYSAMILLSAAFGLSFVAAIVGFEVGQPQTLTLAEPIKLLLRAVASFAGGCGFAILYNSSARAVIVVGLLALAANELRLTLHDAGIMLAPSAFFAAFTVGLIASGVHKRLHEPRIAITVPSIIIMVPGLYAFEMIVLLNQGRMLDALQAAASFAFVIGAMAMGLTTARMLTDR